MEYFGRVITSVSEFYKDLNPSTLSGAIDVVVIEEPDGSLACSPFHVRFGKISLLRPQEKTVEILVNGNPVYFPMKVSEAGDAYFVTETEKSIPSELQTSPMAHLNEEILNKTSEACIESKVYEDYNSNQKNSISVHSEDHNQLKKEVLVNTSNLTSGAYSRVQINDAFVSPRDAGLVERGSDDYSLKEASVSLSDTEYESIKRNYSLPDKRQTKARTDVLGPLSDSEMSIYRAKDDRSRSKTNLWTYEMHECLVADSESVLNKFCQPEFAICSVPWTLENVNRSFIENKIDFSTYQSAPELMVDAHLLVKINDRFYPWSIFWPMLTSLIMFNKPLSNEDFLAYLNRLKFPEEQARGTFTMGDKQVTDSSSGRLDYTGISWKQWWESYKFPVEQRFERPLSSLHSKFSKTLVLTSTQLKSLNLRYGSNSVSFSVNTKLQGKATCHARLFLWKHDVQIVISDIDGTITKSDALGHLFAMVGRDWTHPGIANLYTNIKKNGYEILYLTSRAIGQADITRSYLRGIEQENYQLPDGPVLMSPDRLMAALKREVIDRRPEEFKIACLRSIKRLFGNRNPFYAGFGNRFTDALSYRAVGIPSYRIYSINTNGEIKMDFFNGYISSLVSCNARQIIFPRYIILKDIVDHIFPPINQCKLFDEKGSVQLEMNNPGDDFNDYSFWRPPISPITDPSVFNYNTTIKESAQPIFSNSSIAKLELTMEEDQEYEDAGQLGDSEAEDDFEIEDTIEPNSIEIGDLETIGAYPYI